MKKRIDVNILFKKDIETCVDMQQRKKNPSY